jgi:hypothetical protein
MVRALSPIPHGTAYSIPIDPDISLSDPVIKGKGTACARLRAVVMGMHAHSDCRLNE